MITVLLTTVIFMLAVIGLAMGAILRRAPLKGSCGGCGKCLCQRESHE